MNGVRRNPQRRTATQAGLDKAAQMIEEFSGHAPDSVLRVSEKPFTTGAVIGKLDGVLYSTVRDGVAEKYIHRFKRKSRPLLATSSDGKHLRIVGGQFKFGEAGIDG